MIQSRSDLARARAIWQAGWRAGHQCGNDYAIAFEHECETSLPQCEDDAWEWFVVYQLACPQYAEYRDQDIFRSLALFGQVNPGGVGVWQRGDPTVADIKGRSCPDPAAEKRELVWDGIPT